jgi:hypothetical protein
MLAWTENVLAAGQAFLPLTMPSILSIIVSSFLPKHSQARYNIPVLNTARKDYTHWKLYAQLIFRAQDL